MEIIVMYLAYGALCIGILAKKRDSVGLVVWIVASILVATMSPSG